jgi:hypothetical protein
MKTSGEKILGSVTANFSIVTVSKTEQVASNVLLRAVINMWGDDA